MGPQGNVEWVSNILQEGETLDVNRRLTLTSLFILDSFVIQELSKVIYFHGIKAVDKLTTGLY